MSGIIFSEGSGLNDSIYGKCQAPIRMMIEQRAEAFESMSLIPLLFAMDTSENFADTITTMTAMNDWQPVGENGARPKNSMQEGFKKYLEYVTWKSEFSISQEIIEDDKILHLRQEPKKFLDAYYRTRERFAHALLGAAINGKTAASFGGRAFDTTTADGKCLFATNHPTMVSKETQSNLFANELSEDALGLAETAMQNFVGDNGEELMVAPDTIVIPNNAGLKKKVFAIVGADKMPSDSTNGFNYHVGRWNIIIDPYLNRHIPAGKSPWILMDSTYNKDYIGARWVDRVKANIRSFVNEANDANVWAGRARYSACFNDFRAFCIGGITGGTTLA